MAGDGHRVQVEQPFDLLHHRRDTPRVIEELRRPPPCRAQVEDIGDLPVEPVEGVDVNLNPGFMGNRREMQQAVGAPGHRRVDEDRVFKTLPGQELRRPQLGVPGHFGRPLPRFIGIV